jgi:hypothetical protein
MLAFSGALSRQANWHLLISHSRGIPGGGCAKEVKLREGRAAEKLSNEKWTIWL